MRCCGVGGTVTCAPVCFPDRNDRRMTESRRQKLLYERGAIRIVIEATLTQVNETNKL